MGKHKHSKDKLYILQSEYRRDAVKKKYFKSQNSTYLPFNYCCISLTPFDEPYCDENGRLYDKKSVLEEMKKKKNNEKTEHSINIKNLIKANFYKHNNEYICPITRKYFNKHTKIILNKKTGNVYSSEIFKLFKNKNEMFDPLTHDYMNKSDLIVLQDPLNTNKVQEINKEIIQKNKNTTQSIQENGAIINILEEVKNKKKENEKDMRYKNESDIIKTEETYENISIHNKEGIKNEMQLKKTNIYENEEFNKLNKRDKNISLYDSDSSENELKIKCKNYSDNKLAQCVTSTISNITYKNDFIYLPESEVYNIVYEKVHKNKKNSYVRLITDIGMINIELYAHIYPKLCHNFLFLCEYKYYNNTDIFKKNEDIVYLGSSKNNFHCAASGFYWKKKLKKNNLRNKLNEVNIQKLKEKLMSVNSDNDSDVDIKYIKYNDNKHIGENSCFGNIYFFKYYNQKYSNMFYICLTENYTTNDICIGKVVGGNETLIKLKNLDSAINNDMHYSLNETIIYTNPFKDVIKEMKEKIKTEEKKVSLQENIGSFIDDENFVENKNDNVGKYINWNEIKRSNHLNNDEELNKQRLNILKKETSSKLTKMDFSFW
ncbi:peptidyl-prolyl cis-trans isomerase, putative [Plasmodium gallinaceum]|uniref:Peptidyl-prolyl cis-trans isomerase, putative n=1 Tax=Plasmodium gallinaceum TaxID=5849 RepID=A0A1J1GX15_PLAGA|nr:peptidyl-prolyl cis-trans isomerase, putative [Plasmodium gallinaceum]CRG96854.1 peptidyl-prolyl cis-trans isomerase, putative [Plasmodium gallinaceum]